MDQDNLHFNLSWVTTTMSHRAGRKPRPDPARQVGSWLARVGGPDTAWDSLWPSLERQSALQADVDRFSTEFHCGRTLVRETGRQQLAWYAFSTAQAAKMRNLRISLETFLTDRGWHFIAVNIRTQPAKDPRGRAVIPARKSTKQGLTTDQLALWRRLETELEPGSLRDAVAGLILHHTGQRRD